MQASAVQEALGSLVVGIDHVTIAVRDLDQSVAWYERALGFRAGERRVTRGERTAMKHATLTCGQAVIVLVQGLEAESQVSRFVAEKGEGVSHLALAVSDLNAALLRIEALAGKAYFPVVEDHGIRQVFLQRDHATGVRIELIERSGGSFNERSIRSLYVALEARDEY